MADSTCFRYTDDDVEVAIDCWCKFGDYSDCMIPSLSKDLATHPPSLSKETVLSDRRRQPCTPETVLLTWTLTLKYFCGRKKIAFIYTKGPPQDEGLLGDSDSSPYSSGKVIEIDFKDTHKLQTGELLKKISRTLKAHSEHSCCEPKGEPMQCLTVIRFAEPTEKTEQVYPNDSRNAYAAVGSFYWYIPACITDHRRMFVMSTFWSIFDQIERYRENTINQIDMYEGDWKQNEKYRRRMRSNPPMIQDTICSMIEKQATETPECTAVATTEAFITYAELIANAEKISSKLSELGVGAGSIVPVLCTKQIWVPSAMFAVMKTGAAYLATDPSHPRERILRSVQQVGARVIIRSPDAPVLDIPEAIQLELSDQIIADLPRSSKRFPAVDPQSLAYVIPTSGSTGRPKAVMIANDSFVTSAVHHGAALLMGSSTRTFQFASYAFDPSVLEMFTTLIHGGCVCVPSEEQRMTALAETATALHCNWLTATPTVMSLIQPEDLPTVKCLVIGGEPATRLLLDRWADKVKLFQVWGPAEASVIATVRRCYKGDDPQLIGDFVGCTGLIVNAEDSEHVVPDGTMGQVVLKGPIVANGFMNDDEKSRVAFPSSEAWSPIPGFNESGLRSGRVYRTGDMCYFNSDGQLVFVGRKDKQVKVDGIRVKIGEIETGLQEALPLAESVVVEYVPLKAHSEKKTLVAFVVAKDGNGTTLTKKDLTQYVVMRQANINSKLLSATRPAIYLPLGSMPSNTNGKADRHALRALLADADPVGLLPTHEDVQPVKEESRPEQALRDAWSFVTGVPQQAIGRQQDFIGIGGSSLTAIKMIAKLKEEGWVCRSSDVFAYPVLADLAQHLQEISLDSTESTTVPAPFSMLRDHPDVSPTNLQTAIETIARDCNVLSDQVEDIYPATSEQVRMAWESSNNQGSHYFCHHFLMDPSLAVKSVRDALESVTQQLPILRTRFAHGPGGGVWQVVVKSCFEWYDNENIIDKATACEFRYGQNLSAWRCVVEDEDTGHDIEWYWHHNIADGWTVRMIWDAIEKALAGKVVQTVPLSRYVAYISKQSHQEADNFWRRYLEGTPTSLILRKPSEEYKAFQTQRQEVLYETKIETIGQITVATMIKAAWIFTLAYFQEIGDVIFRTSGTGRNIDIPGIASVAGPTLTSFPVRVRLDMSVPISSFVEKLQNELNRMAPFEYRGMSEIARINEDCRRACSPDLPYLLVQSEDFRSGCNKIEELPGDWTPSRTPLAVCCIPYTQKVALVAGFDEAMIGAESVCVLLAFFNAQLKVLTESLRNGGTMPVGKVVKGVFGCFQDGL